MLSFVYLNFAMAFVASWSQKLFEAVLAVKIALFFDEADVLQWTTTAAVHTDEVIWTPDFSKSSDEWASAHATMQEKIHFY